MKVKIISLLACVSLFVIWHYPAQAEKREKQTGGNAPQQASWTRLGDAPRQPEDGTYVVREGDTLWDITNSFLKDPFQWQKLWKKNSYIINPNLIYPGNKIRLFFLEPVETGEKAKEAGVAAEPAAPESLPVEKLQKTEEAPSVMPKTEEEKPEEEPAKEKEAEAVQPPPAPAVTEEKAASQPVQEVVKISSAMMERHGLISAKDMEGSGAIIGSKEEKLLLSQGDIVYISVAKGMEVIDGDKFTIFATIGEVKHPVTEKPVGFLTDTLGISEVLKAEKDGVITARIVKSYKEIVKGARLKFYEPPVREVTVKKPEKTVDGFIIASLEGKVGVAQNDIVYLDKGKNSGLEQGNAMNISRPTTTAKDPMSADKKTITLPPAELGSLVIIHVEDDTSAAFITKSKQVIYKGDRVRTVE